MPAAALERAPFTVLRTVPSRSQATARNQLASLRQMRSTCPGKGEGARRCSWRKICPRSENLLYSHRYRSSPGVRVATGTVWEERAAPRRGLRKLALRRPPEGFARGLHKGARRHGMMAVSGGCETVLADARRKALRFSRSSDRPRSADESGDDIAVRGALEAPHTRLARCFVGAPLPRKGEHEQAD